MQNIPANTAVQAAAAYAGLSVSELSDLCVLHSDGLFEIRFDTDWMRYDCYVDDADGEVLGFDCRPIPEQQMLGEVVRLSA